MVIIHNNTSDYTPEELFTLQQAGEQLLICEQGDTRTLEETRIMVAYKRLKQEGNFKIVAEKPAKAIKERKAKKLTKKAWMLLYMKIQLNQECTADEMADYEHSKQFWM